jgi:hypothetical protein
MFGMWYRYEDSNARRSMLFTNWDSSGVLE